MRGVLGLASVGKPKSTGARIFFVGFCLLEPRLPSEGMVPSLFSASAVPVRLTGLHFFSR